MSTNKTKNYNLHAWEPGDDFLRSEFNENFAAIDTALGEKSELAAGTYEGDGAKSRVISLGFTPRAVLVMQYDGATYEARNIKVCGGLALEGFPVKQGMAGGWVIAVEIVEGGFRVAYEGDACTNTNGIIYHYLALR